MQHNADAEAVARLFGTLPRLVAEDADLMRRGRFLDCAFEIGIGVLPLLVIVRAGRIEQVTRGPFLLRSTDFSLHAEPQTWAKVLEPMPEAGWHDLLALTKTGRARITGNLLPFMGNLQYVKDVLAAPRRLATVQVQP